MARKARTLLELCIARAGGGFRAIPQGARVCEYVVEWAIASAVVGRFATTADYAEFWKIAVRNAARHRAAVRELFSEDELRELVDALVAEHGRELRRAAREPEKSFRLASAPVAA